MASGVESEPHGAFQGYIQKTVVRLSFFNVLDEPSAHGNETRRTSFTLGSLTCRCPLRNAPRTWWPGDALWCNGFSKQLWQYTMPLPKRCLRVLRCLSGYM
jgi:hypothetical protein